MNKAAVSTEPVSILDAIAIPEITVRPPIMQFWGLIIERNAFGSVSLPCVVDSVSEEFILLPRPEAWQSLD